MGATLGRRPRVIRMAPSGRAGPRDAPSLSATTAAVALIGGWTWAAAVAAGGFRLRVESISALAASATAHRWVMATGLVDHRARPPRHRVGAGARSPGGARPPRRAEGSPRWASPPCHFPRGPSRRSRTPWSLPPRSSSSECGPGSRPARTDLRCSTATSGSAGRRGAHRVGGLARGGARRPGVRPARAGRRRVHRHLAARDGGRPLVVGRAPRRPPPGETGARRRRVDHGVRDRRGGCHGRRARHRRDPALPVQRHPGPQPRASQLRAGRDDRLRRHRGRVLRRRARACVPCRR